MRSSLLPTLLSHPSFPTPTHFPRSCCCSLLLHMHIWSFATALFWTFSPPTLHPSGYVQPPALPPLHQVRSIQITTDPFSVPWVCKTTTTTESAPAPPESAAFQANALRTGGGGNTRPTPHPHPKQKSPLLLQGRVGRRQQNAALPALLLHARAALQLDVALLAPQGPPGILHLPVVFLF